MLTAEHYREAARDSVEAAERHRAQGDLAEAKEWYLTAILDTLRAAVRIEGGHALLETDGVLQCLRAASELPHPAHPTYLLDAAHVALLMGEVDVAEVWLTSAASTRWSKLWARYAVDLCSLVRGARLVDAAVPLDMQEQQDWVPYVDLMRALAAGRDTSAALEAVGTAFQSRQAQLADPGLLDGRPGDPILWDWRLATIMVASRLRP